MRALTFFLCGTLAASISWGRVFNITDVSVAPYVMLNGATSSLAAKPFQSETSQNLSYSSGFGSSLSGEFGFVFSQSIINLKLGLEILKPPTTTVTASSNSDSLYSVASDLQVFIPKIAIEFNLHGNQISRSFASLGYGAVSIGFKNQYQLTSLGQTAFPGVSDHLTEIQGSGSSYSVGLGYEGHLSDRTTILCELGYRSMKITNSTYANSGTTLSGDFASGQSWKKADGSQRELDFSGAFIGIGFRFYL